MGTSRSEGTNDPRLCLETVDLSHRYADQGSVVTDVNLQVPQGCIYGFLGPNGAGKTTTLRLVLGLLKIERGRVALFGKDFSKNRVSCLANIGSLIEGPSLYEHLTAGENLRIVQRIHRRSKTRIGEVLERVGLADTGNKLVGQFSLGMKQRLGIGIAMLHHPALLILDEPTNGLDPNGIVEIRELLMEVNRENGVTIVISSHLLSEIDKLASHVGIIHHGRLLFQGTLEELRHKRQAARIVKLGTNDNLRTLQLLSDRFPIARIGDEGVTIPSLPNRELAAINRKLVEQGIDVHEITTVETDLETIFLKMVSD